MIIDKNILRIDKNVLQEKGEVPVPRWHFWKAKFMRKKNDIIIISTWITLNVRKNKTYYKYCNTTKN